MKAPAALLLVAVGLFMAALASATPLQSATPETSAAAPAATPSWDEPAGCDARSADLASLFRPAAASTATDMCGPCTLFLCKNAAVGSVCIIGNHRGFCVSLGSKCSDNVTWQCDCRLPG